jgi:hypothetical protein
MKLIDANGKPCILGRVVIHIPGHLPAPRWTLIAAVRMADGTIAPDYPIWHEELSLHGQKKDIVRYLVEAQGYKKVE